MANKVFTGFPVIINEADTDGVLTVGSTDISEAEIGVLDGVTNGTAAASKAVVLDSSGDIIMPGKIKTSSGVGTVTTSGTTVAEEYGNGISHITKLTLTAFAVGTSGDNASLAIGAKFYTLPAGAMIVEDASISGTVLAAISVTTNTPDTAIGTVIGSGANAVVSAVGATSENVLGGVAAASVNNGAVSGSSVTGPGSLIPLFITSAGVHDLYLNMAAAWADVAAAGAVTFTGVITIKWRKVS